jgi:hypothetical protein
LKEVNQCRFQAFQGNQIAALVIHNVFRFHCITSSHHVFEPFEFFCRRWAYCTSPEPRFMRRVGSWLDRRNVFAIWFDDVLASVWSAHDVTPVVRLNEYIVRTNSLHVVDNARDWSTLT